MLFIAREELQVRRESKNTLNTITYMDTLLSLSPFLKKTGYHLTN